MNKDLEYDIKCGIAMELALFPNSEFEKEIRNNFTIDSLSKECREFVELCYKNKDKFRKDKDSFKFPEELKKFIK